MLDRLACGIVAVPPSAYDTIVILADVDESYAEGSKLIDRELMTRIVKGLKPGGRLRSQDRLFGLTNEMLQNEFILAGLINDGSAGFVKPDYNEQYSVPLQFAKRRNGRQRRLENKDNTSDLEVVIDDGVRIATGANGISDELIDEDALLAEDDLASPIIQRRPLSTSLMKYFS
jgi:anamorsin